ncbi:glycosyltransferase [Saccharicrinis sp. FJH54]
MLLKKGCKVTIATSPYLFNSYLSKELPDVELLSLLPYEPTYSRSGSQVLRLLWQLPHFIRVYASDASRIRTFIKGHNVRVVFSDNRFSCRSKTVKSIYMTHQVNILKPSTLKPWGLPSKIHRYLMRKFDLCIIPDVPEHCFPELTRFSVSKPESRYLGFISRFGTAIQHNKKHILAIISGPEPQRSFLEDRLITAAYHTDEKIVLVRGSDRFRARKLPDNIIVYNIADTVILKKLLQDCSYVVCRSGYSSIMDLLVTRTPAIIIPTPGQSEQEYIAERAEEMGWFVVRDQYNFDYLKPEVVRTQCKLPALSQINLNRILSEIM